MADDEWLLSMLIAKSSKQSFFGGLPFDGGVELSLLYGLFLNGTVEAPLGLLSLCCALLVLFIDGAAARVVPLAAAAAAAMARLAFLCRIPQALQSDCSTIIVQINKYIKRKKILTSIRIVIKLTFYLCIVEVSNKLDRRLSNELPWGLLVRSSIEVS